MRVLLSEGSSTSAREAITILGLTGHDVEICDPDRGCLGRYSRFVRRFHRCPGLRDDPRGYLAFVEDLISREHFDVLIPIHEQGYVFAAAARNLHSCTGIALPSFASYRNAVRKTDFSRLLADIGLHQPPTQILESARELDHLSVLPCIVKAPIGTASQSVWHVRDRKELSQVRRQLAPRGDDELMVQEYVTGSLERAQAVFSCGRLLATHAWRQLRPGAGGGDAIKESVDRAEVRSDLAQLGERLAWHGALSVDYIVEPETSRPLYIDCNPRLVEPMHAFLCGLDELDVLMRVSLNASIGDVGRSRSGVRTHLGMQALLRCAATGGTRRELLRELRRLRAAAGDYENSREELTPVRMDWLSAIPFIATASILLLRPAWATRLTRRFGAHVLSTRTARSIEREIMG
jgi:predicted ATP-grasp superfamily ATP-dependent carboligase